jgi:membrane-associated phospholipid phosphatase
MSDNLPDTRPFQSPWQGIPSETEVAMTEPSSSLPFRERFLTFLFVWALWLTVYFGVAHLPHPAPAVLVWDPVWRLPLVSAFALPYTSAYCMPIVLLFVPCDRARFRRFVAAFAAAILASAPFFVLLPLVPPRLALGDGPLDRLLALQFFLDVDGNCFPSLHVSMAVLTALAVGRCVPRARAPMLLWAALVAVSTVFVHQHYAVDVAAGVALAVVVWNLAFLRSASP